MLCHALAEGLLCLRSMRPVSRLTTRACCSAPHRPQSRYPVRPRHESIRRPVHDPPAPPTRPAARPKSVTTRFAPPASPPISGSPSASLQDWAARTPGLPSITGAVGFFPLRFLLTRPPRRRAVVRRSRRHQGPLEHHLDSCFFQVPNPGPSNTAPDS
jgi:hypothetical protein